ncbi:MAG: DUF4286 family protein [Saprospiraceae bacterium]|nr:DUF4286 family protein [Saprospiraceae bacterium]
MPVVYNVTIIIDHSVHDEWVDWMKNEHIPEVMATGKFTSWKMLRIIEDHNPDGMTYAIQYQAPDMETYLTYQTECARIAAGCPKQVWRPVWSFSHLYGGN